MSTDPHAPGPEAPAGRPPDERPPEPLSEEWLGRFDRPPDDGRAGPSPASRPEAPDAEAEPTDAAPDRAERAEAAADADVFADIPQARIEELVVELGATGALQNLKIEIRGLDLSLLLRADLDNLTRMVLDPGEGSEGGHGGLARRLAPAVAGGAGARLLEHAGGESRDDEPGDEAGQGGGRAGRVARTGGKAAALTAAGVGLAVAGSRLGAIGKGSLPGPLGGRRRGVLGVVRRVLRGRR